MLGNSRREGIDVRITTTMQAQHRHCDELLAHAEAAARRKDWSACAAAARDFVAATEAHLALEESGLFPALEQATGMRDGPTQMMRIEHGEMRELMAGLNAAVAAQDGDEFLGCCETLLILLQQHNMKEENILYPLCDRAVPEFAASL
jgi:hemerythrin-like domain-containing protein